MSYRNTHTTYGSVTKFFHWLTFILITLMLLMGYFMDDVPKDLRPNIVNVHKLLGIFILFLILLRICWGLINPKPSIVSFNRLNVLERWLEKGVHGALYGVLIAMPLAGWIMTSASGKAPHWGRFLFMLPGIPYDKVLSKTAKFMHSQIAILLIALIIIHVLAALYHHFIKKDDVLRRMMPKF